MKISLLKSFSKLIREVITTESRKLSKAIKRNADGYIFISFKFFLNVFINFSILYY